MEIIEVINPWPKDNIKEFVEEKLKKNKKFIMRSNSL